MQPVDKKWVVCVKHGAKYSSEYVNKLFNMVKRNLTIDYEFACFTEDPVGINSGIKILPLPQTSLHGWWNKVSLFDSNIDITGTILYLDLDVIVFQNIDKLFSYNEGELCIIRDFNRIRVRDYKRINSSVFRFQSGRYHFIYKDFINDVSNLKRFHGDQDWIYSQFVKYNTSFSYWPDEWIQSYKWEMRKNPPMTRDAHGKRNFLTKEDPVVDDENSIAVFHGDPNPNNCQDNWCIDNWR